MPLLDSSASLAARSLTVTVRLPLALSTVAFVRLTSIRPLPSTSVSTVAVSPSALVVLTVFERIVLLTLNAVVVSTALPSLLTTLTSVRSVLPSALPSTVVFVVLRSALSVVTVVANNVPLALLVVTVFVRLPLASRAVTSVVDRSKEPLPLRSIFPVTVRPSADVCVTC